MRNGNRHVVLHSRPWPVCSAFSRTPSSSAGGNSGSEWLWARVRPGCCGLVLDIATRVVAAGVLVGLVLSAVLSRWIAGFLFGITPLDPITFGAVVAVLALTGVLATLAPALRAARVDPVIAFRIDQ